MSDECLSVDGNPIDSAAEGGLAGSAFRPMTGEKQVQPG